LPWREEVAGKSGSYSVTVDEQLTAHHFGNEGIHVLATAMTGLFAEQALHDLLIPLVPAGSGIIGVRQQTYHRAPAPVGARVKATVFVERVEDQRVHYRFHVETDTGMRLADGDGESAVVSMSRFLQKAGAAHKGT
jgi:predicted thioesterase